MKYKNLLLVIDMQNDFCLPTGSLFVDGAAEDVMRLSEFIRKNQLGIDSIIFTQDTHNVIDISHPAFWSDIAGNSPEPYTIISTEDIETKKWHANFKATEAEKYIKEIEIQGEFPHIIWPEHCIVGSTGAAIVDELMESAKNWARQGRSFQIIQKGLNPLTEHFGALRANIPDAYDPYTQLNSALVKTLNTYNTIFIAGQAKSHCVANTINQMCDIEGLPEKLVILDDAMSNVRGFETLALPIYEKAQRLGAQISTTDKITQL